LHDHLKSRFGFLQQNDQFSYAYSAFARKRLLILSDSELSQESHHRAPVRKRGLDQVDRDKAGKQKPVRAVKVTKQHCGQDKTTGD
jgi:hypothetical protein